MYNIGLKRLDVRIMESEIIDFLKRSLEDKDLFDSIVEAENEDELYDIYRKLNGDCDKGKFVGFINKLIEDALSAYNLNDSQLENVTGGINNMRFDDVSRKIVSSILAISSLAVPMSSVSAQYHSYDSYRGYQNTKSSSFFEEHPELKKAAIAGGVTGIGALSIGALYLLLHNKDSSEQVDQSASLNGNTSQTRKPSIKFSKYNHAFSKRMIDYSDNYWSGDLIPQKGLTTQGVLDRIHFIRGSISTLKTTRDITVDVVVNAANPSLAPGGGVCGCIFGGAGAALQTEIKSLKRDLSIGTLNTGAAVITSAHNLTDTQGVKAIIHTPGPNLQGRQGGVVADAARKQLASAYGSSIELAAANGFKSIAFPSISTGIFGFPVEEASKIAVNSVINALKTYEDMHVYFVVFPSSQEEPTYDNMLFTLNKNYEGRI